METLTETQARVVAFLRGRVDAGEPPPTYRDLCREFGWASTATVRDHLRALARKGHVELGQGRARRVRLREPAVPVARVPVLGRVVAGVPEAAEQEVEGCVPVPAGWARRGAHFALKVRGDSMSGAGILEGDQVVVRARADAEAGDIVVATVDGETTVKRLERRGGRSLLVAENPEYEPIEVRSRDAVIHGVVVGLLREYPVRTGRRVRRGRKG